MRPTSLIERKAVLTPANLCRVLTSLRRGKKTIVFTNGCFDLFHVGHARYLEQARSYGDALIVGVNSDASVRSLKGAGRPVLSLRDRMALLSHLKSVDFVVPFSAATPIHLIHRCRPDVLIKGGDWTADKIVGADFVLSYGGKVLSGIKIKGVSTTQIISAIRSNRTA